MSGGEQDQSKLGSEGKSESAGSAKAELGLTIRKGAREVLSPAQVEFNKRMVALEKGRVALERERARLDDELRMCVTVLMPLLERANRAEAEMIHAVRQAAESLKLTSRRRELLEDLLVEKADRLLGDPVGLDEGQIERLEALIKDLAEVVSDEERGAAEIQDLQRLREMMEAVAKRAGLEVDLDDVDFTRDPEDVSRQIKERFSAAGGKGGKRPDVGSQRKRKPTKAAVERERVKKEMEEAKKRDFKSLYKQLAKVLHPDLETDPLMKAHKEEWMKRLTTAQAGGDLRDMLAIEMEWLGEEAGNLSKASDEKLRVYAMVLKEQLDDLKVQTRMLIQDPIYDPLVRFLMPGERRPAGWLRIELSEEIAYLKDTVAGLRAGGTRARLLINALADDYGRSFQ